MPLSDRSMLRQLLGEDIPVDGDESDTLFTEEEIQNFLDQNPGIERAAYQGWRVKAARLSSLVDTTEGNVQRKFSQLHDSAQEMIKHYSKSTTGATEGRARVGRARRAGVEW